MSAILKEDPAELSATNQAVSPALERIVRHCLEKAPERRLHSAHDLAFELEALTQTSGQTVPAQGRSFSRRILAALGIAALLAALLAAFWLGRLGGTSGAKTAPRSYAQLTTFAGAEQSPALSPDGQMLAFVRRAKGNSRIWVLRTGGENPTDLTADCSLDSGTPAFSPDGKLIAYSTACGGGGLMLVGATGENARRLTNLGDSPAWSPDGREIVYDTETGWNPYGRSGTSELWIADVASGKTRKVFAGDAVQPSVSPNGLRIAYWGIPADGSQRDIWTIPYGGLAGGEKPVAVTQDAAVDWNPAWSADGRDLYFLSTRDGTMNLWRVPIDEKSGRPLGPAEARTLPASDVAGFAVSSDGRHLGYCASSRESWIERLALDPATGEARGAPVEVFRASRTMPYAFASPDGTLLTFDSQGSIREDIFVAQADGTRQRRLTDDAARDRASSFFPDGKRVAFQSDRGGSWDLWSIATDGSGLRQLTRGENVYIPLVSPDGRHIAASDATTVFLYDLDESGGVTARRKLPLPPGVPACSATDWSPDGTGILAMALRKDFTFDRPMLYSLERSAWLPLPPVPGIGNSWATFAGPHRLIANVQEGLATFELPGGAQRLLLANPGDGRLLGVSVNREGTEVLVGRVRQNVDIWMATPP